MIRRLAKPVAVFLALACVSVATQHAEYLEALTANLASLIDGQSLIEGDKTFSNFTFSAVPTSVATGGSLTLPDPHLITVTASTVDGVVTLSVPLHASATTAALGAGGSGNSIGSFNLGFDVTVTGSSDVISSLALTATGTPPVGPNTGSDVLANLSVEGSSDAFGHISITSPSSGSATIPPPGLNVLGVSTTGTLIAETSSAPTSTDIDTLTFGIGQTTPVAAPEPGSLILILGGAGMVLARRLVRRRA